MNFSYNHRYKNAIQTRSFSDVIGTKILTSVYFFNILSCRIMNRN